ncbi:MAG: PPOX class F420-dependent oxidoreductase [Actinobacteria bacterium]|nr:PPOX class F420-dependent oxidoreductase [Actinomycetota bacterium]
MPLDPRITELATAKNFAALTTLLPDGHPQTQVMWVHADDEHVLINTEVGRQKYRNVERDPRVTVTVWDAANPYRYVEVRGRVAETVTGPDARDNIDELSHKYTGHDYSNPIGTERVVLRIAVERVHANGV